MSSEEDENRDNFSSNDEGDLENFEDTLYRLIGEFFSKNQYLTRITLPNFLEFIGLSSEWESSEEQDCLWKSFDKYSKNGLVDEKGARKGFGEFLSSQPEEEVSRMSRMSINVTNSLMKNLASMKAKEKTEVIEEEPQENIKEVEENVYDDKNYIKFINETDPEILRKYYATFIILDIGKKDILNYSELDGFTRMYSFYKFTFDDIVEFLLYFAEDVTTKKLFKINRNKFGMIVNEMKGLVQSYKDTFENVSYGGSPQKQNYDIPYFGDTQTVFNQIVDDIILIERECEAYANLISTEKLSNSFFVTEIVFLCHQRQFKLDMLRVLFLRSISQFQEMQEEYRQLNQKLIDCQTNNSDEEQIEQLLSEIAMLKEDKEIKFNEIGKLKEEIINKEAEMQTLTNTMHQMELYEESQCNEIANLKNEISDLKKKYDSGVNKVLEKIRVENEEYQKKSMKFHQPQPFFQNEPSGNIISNNKEGDGFGNLAGYSLTDLEEEKKGTNIRLKKMSYDQLITYTRKVDMDNQELINRANSLEDKIKEISKRLELATRNYEETKKENVLMKSENTKLQNQINELSKEVEMNNMFRPSNAYNLCSRFSRVSNAQPLNNLHCQVSNIKTMGTSTSNIKSVTFTSSSMKEMNNQQDDIEKEEKKEDNLIGENECDLGSLGTSSNNLFFPSKENTTQFEAKEKELQQEQEGEVIELGGGNFFSQKNFAQKKDNLMTNATTSNTLRSKDSQAYKTNKTISYNTKTQDKIDTKQKKTSDKNNMQNFFKQMEASKSYKDFKPKNISKEIEIGDDDYFQNQEEDLIMNQLDDFNSNKNNLTTQNKKSKEKNIVSAINSANIGSKSFKMTNTKLISKLSSKNKNGVIEEEDDEDEDEKQIIIEKRPRSLSPEIIKASSSNSNKKQPQILTDKEYFNIRNFGGLTATVQYPPKKTIKKSKSHAIQVRPSYDFLSVKNQETINGILERHSENYSSYDLFSDIVYLIDPSSYKRTKKLFLTTGSKIYLFEITDHNKYISREGLSAIIISDKNSNLVALEFGKNDSLIIENLRRTSFLMYFKNRVVKGFSKIKFHYKDNIEMKTITKKKKSNNVNFTSLPIMADFEGAKKIGYLYKQGQILGYKNFNERFVVLTEIGLLYFDDPPKQPRRLIPITNCDLFYPPEPKYKRDYVIEILSINSELYVFAAMNMEDFVSWRNELEALRNEYNNTMRKIDVRRTKDEEEE